MGKSCTQTYETKKEELLNPETTENIANSSKNGAITEVDKSIISKLSGEATPGFSKEALYINGYSPINELVNEISEKMKTDVKTIEDLYSQIMSEGNTHTVNEVTNFKSEVASEYLKRQEAFYNAINTYNKEVVTHNTTAEEHNNKEKEKKENEEKDIMPSWDQISPIKTGENVEEFEKEKVNPEPKEDVPSSTDVKVTEKNYADAFDLYVREYEKVKDWLKLPISFVSTKGQIIKIPDKYKNYKDEMNGTKYPDGTKVVTVKKDDGSIEYYRYDKDNNLIEVHTVDANKKDHYYTNTGVPATKFDENNPQSPVIPSSVLDGVDKKDIKEYDDAIVIHRRENGKSVFYTYDKNGNIKSIKDEQGTDVTGAALRYEDSKYNSNAPYEIAEEYRNVPVKDLTNPNNSDDNVQISKDKVGNTVKTVKNEDGSKSEYKYDTHGDLAEIHVTDENGNNYYYTDKGEPASKASKSIISPVIPNTVLDGGEVTSYDLTTVVHRRENGQSVFYTYQNGSGELISVNNDKGQPVTGQFGSVNNNGTNTSGVNTTEAKPEEQSPPPSSTFRGN